MKEVWSRKWKEVLIWFSAYISFIAFSIIGGYTIIKGNDDDLKKTAKTALIVTLIYSAVSAFLLVFHYFASMAEGYYSSGAYDFYSITSNLVNIAKIVVYAVFIIIALVKTDETKKVAKDTKKEEN